VDLNTVTEVVSPAGVGDWRPGDVWLGGGTALFGEPRPEVVRLLDLAAAGWTPLARSGAGLEIAATCTIAELYRGAVEQAELVRGCCRAFLASFKIWNVATVGGNLCSALPAGPMITLAVALDGVCRVEGPGGVRRVPALGFVTGDGTTVLGDGELLRSIVIPAGALAGATALRQGSLFDQGRSAALIAGRRSPGGEFVVTVTASTVRPYQVRFAALPAERELRAALAREIPENAWMDDLHGLPRWRRHLTFRYAEEIRQELAG
jgi:CO/xanthine dehydrogenase FAD-binding subunit